MLCHTAKTLAHKLCSAQLDRSNKTELILARDMEQDPAAFSFLKAFSRVCGLRGLEGLGTGRKLSRKETSLGTGLRMKKS